ncbi:MAG: Hsp20/alpha crystallin family protein, partial [Acetobacteraceae bacterium]|nr:Hsp20/alpha crystallin family protein [Acetobacteraceae bacterium]
MARVPSLFTPGALFAGTGDPFLTLHREMNRLFDDVMRGGGTPAGFAGAGAGESMLSPHTDVTETEKEVRIKAELPGVNESDIDVSLNDDVLTIRAEKRQERKEERE